MKRFCSAMAMACVSAVMLAAQQTAPVDQAKNDANDNNKSDKITVTGCVQPGDAGVLSPVGTSGITTTTSGSATMPSRGASFILTNATPRASSESTSPTSSTPPATNPEPAVPPTSTAPPSSTIGTSGSTTTASAAVGSGITYRLDGDNLAKYVGKRVEVTGRIDSSGTMSSFPSSATAANAAPAPAHLKVIEVREIGGDCSR